MKMAAVAVAAFLAAGIGAYVYRTVSSFIEDYDSRSRAMERARAGEPDPIAVRHSKRSHANQLIG
jgi:hypothetical protein